MKEAKNMDEEKMMKILTQFSEENQVLSSEHVKDIVELLTEKPEREEGAVRPEDLLDMNSNSYMDFEGFAEGNVTTEACKKAYETMIQGNEPERCKDAFWNILMHLVYEVEDQADAELVDAFAMDAATVLYNLMTIRQFVACNEPRPDKE